MRKFLLVSLLLTLCVRVGYCGMITIVNEDFSGFTKGTENAPDTENILDGEGYVADKTLMQPFPSEYTKTWGGMVAYQAGGCVYIPDGWFFNTPTGDYSGNLKMTFRARLATDNANESETMDILLCRRSALTDFKRDKITLTKEWQTFTFDATNGEFEDTMIQFFPPGENTKYSWLLDDVKIEHEITSIEAPEALPAANVVNDSFTAKWEGTEDADKYLLSVYKKVPDGVPVELNESFESLNVNPDGKTLNAENPGFPEGWNISLSAGSKQQVYTEKEFCGSGTKAICLDDRDDYIETPVSDKPIAKLIVWMKADSREQTGEINSVINVSANSEAAGWTEWTKTAVWNLNEYYPDGVANDYSQFLKVLENIKQVRIKLEKKDNCNLAVDNIMIQYVGDTKPVYLFENKELAKDVLEYKVEGGDFDTDADYFYTVKAQNEEFTSAPSKEIEVYLAHIPTVLPATNVTADSYTANWECGKKADYFKVEQSLTFTAKEDIPNYVVLEEDFSKVKSEGTVENPEEGEYTMDYVSLDKYTKISGWRISSYAFADGMVGGLPYKEPYVGCQLATPKLSLGNNGGVFDVTIRAYLGGQDGLVIQNNAGFQDFTYLDEAGWIEKTVTMQFGSDGDMLRIHPDKMSSFMVDYIKITQTIKAGESSTIVNQSKETADADTHSIDFENVGFEDGKHISYMVRSCRYYHGNEKDVWTSAPSDSMNVIYEEGGVSEIPGRSSFVAVGTDGAIRVILKENANIEVFGIDGSLVKSAEGFAGENRLTIGNAGAYIVRVNGETVKTLVR